MSMSSLTLLTREFENPDLANGDPEGGPGSHGYSDPEETVLEALGPAWQG